MCLEEAQRPIMNKNEAAAIEIGVPAGLLVLYIAGMIRITIGKRTGVLLRQGRNSEDFMMVQNALSLILGAGCATSALLIEPHIIYHCTHIPWPPSDSAIAAAVSWFLGWPCLALLHQHSTTWHASGCDALACVARAVVLSLALTNAAARAQLLPWLPVEVALLVCAVLFLGAGALRARRRARVDLLLRECAVAPLHAQLDASEATAPQTAAHAATEAWRAAEEKQWMDEQRRGELLFEVRALEECARG
eukprot:5818478-Pleurochrysis_carterae.AAC.1